MKKLFINLFFIFSLLLCLTSIQEVTAVGGACLIRFRCENSEILELGTTTCTNGGATTVDCECNTPFAWSDCEDGNADGQNSDCGGTSPSCPH